VRVGGVDFMLPKAVKFPEAVGLKEALEIRREEVRDMVARFGVISPDRVILHNYPVSSPVSVFNASVTYDEKEEALEIFARVIFGYYMYVSSIVGIRVPINDLFNRYVNSNRYTGNIVLYSSMKYDVWGTEDPRVHRFGGKLCMTYVGRSINYFNPVLRRNRTLPITAVYDEDLRTWVKRLVFTLSEEAFGEVISNKDSFLHSASDGSVFLLHRPHLVDESYRLMVSPIEDDLLNGGMTIREVKVREGIEVLKPCDFEGRLGWATPIIRLDDDTLVALVHAVDKDLVVYRVFAVQLKLSRD